MELKISLPKNIASNKDCFNESSGGEKCSIELGLSYSKYSTNGYGFTFVQRQELEQQFIIYKYIEAGKPVPSHLIIPILIGYGHLCWELKSSMEPEPRTDGKKWRCSEGVVPNQKYCEKHMHRGRQRSRKCVEPTSSNLQLSSNSKIKIKSCNNTMRVAAQAHQNSEPDTSTFSIGVGFSLESK